MVTVGDKNQSLTPQEVADSLQIAKNTVYELIKRGELKAYRVGNKFRVEPEELARYKKISIDGIAETVEEKKVIQQGFVICGQDVILDSLSSHLSRRGETQVLRSYVGSYNGLYAFYNNEVSLATAHLWDGDTGAYNEPYVRRLLPGIPAVIFRLVKRKQGFYVKKGNPHNIHSVKDILDKQLRIINREKGSGTRVLLDEHLKKLGVLGSTIEGYDRERTSHLAVASAIAMRDGDVGLGNEKAALQVAEIDFVPLQTEAYDLIIKKEDLSKPLFQKAIEIIQSDAFKKEIEGLGGYDVSEMGKKIATT